MNQPLPATTAPAIAEYTVRDILDLLSDDMRLLNQCIRDRLHSDVALIRQISEYIIYSGGKRLRPMLLILSARACHYQGSKHPLLAAVIEFIHTATLLHDDVVDESALRRGQKSAHSVWGNAASVLVGDFLYSRSFQMMVEVDSKKVMEILAKTTNTIAEGEVLQLLNLGDPEVDENRYMKVIENKTAKLFEAACRLGGVLADQPLEIELALKRFGNGLGCAFQIADDILDYDADVSVLGKNIGDDLAEGKPTLPLIYARSLTSEAGRAVLDQAIRDSDNHRMQAVLDIIHSTTALDMARRKAASLADQAAAELDQLPDSEYRDSLQALCHYAVKRQH